MDFADSDSDDCSLLKGGTRRSARNKGKNGINNSISMDEVAVLLKEEHDMDSANQSEIRRLLKENASVSNSELQERVDLMTSTTRKNRKNNTALQEEMDVKDGYDGAFPRHVFHAMKDVMATEVSNRQGTLPTLYFVRNDEFFFDSKATACSELTSILAATTEKPCELVRRLPALIEKNVLNHFVGRADRFWTILAACDETISSAVKWWIFKVACSAGCGEDLVDLGNAAFLAIQKTGQSVPNLLDRLETLLDCWLVKPAGEAAASSLSSHGSNILGLRNVLVLAAKFYSFDTSTNDLDRILTQIMYVGLDEATTIGFRDPINNLFEPIIAAIAKIQGDGFDRWCKSWSQQFVKDLRNSDVRDSWLALPAAVRLVDMSWSTTTLAFRSCFSCSVLYECLGTDSVQEWLKETNRTYLLKSFEKEMMWTALTVSYFGLFHTLERFDELKQQQTRLRSIVETIYQTYISGVVVYELKTSAADNEEAIRWRFITEFDRTLERLQGGKTAKIASPHILRADYLLSIIHSNSSTLKRRLEDKRSSIGPLKQSNLTAFLSSAKKPESAQA